MTDFKERRFSIDPGKGKKMDGCPYSIYEDGRDVKEYIIPPKGYVFVGFKFDPEASNQIYNGKLTAEYSKEPFNDKIKANLWKFILAFVIVAVIAFIVILAAGVFKDPNPKPKRPTKEPATMVENKDSEKDKGKVAEQNTTSSIDTPIVEPQANETIPETTEVQEEQPEASTPTASDDPNEQFKQAFWSLIHQRTIMMDPYDALFKEYKNKVEGEEYDYLRFTILKDYPSFKEWYVKLHKVPVSELENINTINDLKSKLREIE